MNRIMIIAAAALTLSLSGVPLAHADNRASEQQDCMGDALRLCSQYIPSESAITACMEKKKSQLSPAPLAAGISDADKLIDRGASAPLSIFFKWRLYYSK